METSTEVVSLVWWLGGALCKLRLVAEGLHVAVLAGDMRPAEEGTWGIETYQVHDRNGRQKISSPEDRLVAAHRSRNKLDSQLGQAEVYIGPDQAEYDFSVSIVSTLKMISLE